MFGLLHIPASETILVKGTVEEIEKVFKEYTVYVRDGLYTFQFIDADPHRTHVTGGHTKLIREEFEIYPLTENQINSLNKEFRAKVDPNRNHGASR